MIDYTLPEIRRLLIKIVLTVHHAIDHILAWSHWRRQRQLQARTSHYRKRGYP
ncbi:hypothetical protein [Saccharopolyspora sp. NPDC002376]